MLVSFYLIDSLDVGCCFHSQERLLALAINPNYGLPVFLFPVFYLRFPVRRFLDYNPWLSRLVYDVKSDCKRL